MATKTFCDNCDRQIKQYEYRLNVKFEIPDSNAQADTELQRMHELCTECKKVIYYALAAERKKNEV